MNNKISRVHFIGIGGIGMSALARFYKAKVWAVSGSDVADSKLLKELRRDKIKAVAGHKKSNVPKKCGLVIFNQAIPENNSELKEAMRRGIPTISYPEAVGELTRKYKTIAVAGSHGKSTTTTLVAQILISAGFDPTVIVGTRVKEFGNMNFRLGGAVIPAKAGIHWFVLEADEYGRAFHHYSPFAAIITNIDKEHLDTYKNSAGVKKSFLKFIENVGESARPRGRAEEGGILILNEADKNLKSLDGDIKKIAKKKNLAVLWYNQNQHLKGLSSLGLLPSLLGEHNISNATAAYTLTKALGIPDKTIYDALKNFSGTWRRLEFRGNLQLKTKNLKQGAISEKESEISVYDDYAHHPTEIRASLAALKNNYKLKANSYKLICVFQPHQTERLASLFNDFVGAFKDADAVVLLDVYKVPGREKESRSMKHESSIANSKTLAEAIRKKYSDKPTIYLKNPKQLPSALQNLDSRFMLHDSVLVMMGAGDIVKYTDQLLGKR